MKFENEAMLRLFVCFFISRRTPPKFTASGTEKYYSNLSLYSFRFFYIFFYFFFNRVSYLLFLISVYILIKQRNNRAIRLLCSFFLGTKLRCLATRKSADSATVGFERLVHQSKESQPFSYKG